MVAQPLEKEGPGEVVRQREPPMSSKPRSQLHHQPIAVQTVQPKCFRSARVVIGV